MHSVKATLTSATHPSGGRARSLYERSRGFQPCGISFSQRHDCEPGRFERSVRHDLFGVHVQGTGRVGPPRRRQRLVAAHEWRRRYSSVTAGACCRGSAQQPPAAVDILALAVPISPRSPSAGSSRGASGKRAYSSVCRSSDQCLALVGGKIEGLAVAHWGPRSRRQASLGRVWLPIDRYGCKLN